MKVVVAYKWAPNPQDAEVRPDGTVDWGRARSAVSEYDPVAFELARQLVDAAGGEVVGLTVGDAAIDSTLARKAALSRGLDRLVMVAASPTVRPTTSPAASTSWRASSKATGSYSLTAALPGAVHRPVGRTCGVLRIRCPLVRDDDRHARSLLRRPSAPHRRGSAVVPDDLAPAM